MPAYDYSVLADIYDEASSPVLIVIFEKLG
jgi:hypothetical protein